MCSLCLYYKISFGQLSMYMANRLRKISSSGVNSEHNYSLCQCWQFIEQSPSYFGVSPAFHWNLSGKDTIPTLWPSSRLWRLRMRETEKWKWEMQAPFSFLKPTSHNEKKAMNALAHDLGCPLPPAKQQQQQQ